MFAISNFQRKLRNFPNNFKGRLQSKYKFVLKVEVLYADIPAKNDFFQKFMFWPPEAKRYKYLTIMATDPPTHDNRSSHSPQQILLLMTTTPVH